MRVKVRRAGADTSGRSIPRCSRWSWRMTRCERATLDAVLAPGERPGSGSAPPGDPLTRRAVLLSDRTLPPDVAPARKGVSRGMAVEGIIACDGGPGEGKAFLHGQGGARQGEGPALRAAPRTLSHGGLRFGRPKDPPSRWSRGMHEPRPIRGEAPAWNRTGHAKSGSMRQRFHAVLCRSPMARPVSREGIRLGPARAVVAAKDQHRR